MKIALAQLKLGENIQGNIEKAISTMEEAAKNGANLICFPELQFYPFFPQYKGKDTSSYEIGIEDQVIKSLQEKCKELKMVAVPNFYLNEGADKFDASPLIDSNGEILGISKMVHIVQAEGFYEQDYYNPSESGFKVYNTAIGKVGVVICFDRHYPESIRSCALQGAQIIIIPTANTKDEPLEMFEWELRVPAMQNSVFIAMCNRVGLEGKMDFCGESIVVDPNGGVIVKANDQEQIVYADIEMELATRTRDQKPYFKLRRPEVYTQQFNLAP
jgi:predicted amidohydrolase